MCLETTAAVHADGSHAVGAAADGCPGSHHHHHCPLRLWLAKRFNLPLAGNGNPSRDALHGVDEEGGPAQWMSGGYEPCKVHSN